MTEEIMKKINENMLQIMQPEKFSVEDHGGKPIVFFNNWSDWRLATLKSRQFEWPKDTEFTYRGPANKQWEKQKNEADY